MKKETITEIFGWYGMVSILLAYGLNAFDILTANNMLYIFMNASGAIGMVMVALLKKNYQSFTLNGAWFFIAMASLVGFLFS